MSFSAETYVATKVPGFIVVLWRRRTVVSRPDSEDEVSNARRRAVQTWSGSSLGRF